MKKSRFTEEQVAYALRQDSQRGALDALRRPGRRDFLWHGQAGVGLVDQTGARAVAWPFCISSHHGLRDVGLRPPGCASNGRFSEDWMAEKGRFRSLTKALISN
jgi:hypothetical protein